jgi:Flp pilus assembly protein TadB
MQAEFDKTDLILMTVSSLLYFLFLLGVWMIYSEKVRSCIAKIRMRNRLKARKKAMRPETALEKHLRKVLSTSMKKPMEPKVFFRYSALSFLLVLLAGLRTVNPISSLLMAALISSMPYLMLRVRVETIRRKSSYEGEKLISEFLCRYRMSGLNIYKTIEQVILTSEGTKITGKLLFKLLLELRNTGNPQTIREAAERFAYGINTSWSRMLANCIRLSAENGTNVTLALEDIQLQLREARLLFEERKRLNSESARMVVFLAPAMYFGTAFMTIRYLGMPAGKFLKNQFHTEEGFLLSLMIFFLFLVNLALIEIINNQRFDY